MIQVNIADSFITEFNLIEHSGHMYYYGGKDNKLTWPKAKVTHGYCQHYNIDLCSSVIRMLT